jgi:hypothetical protein
MVAFIQKAHGCIFLYDAIEAQEAQLAISDSRSVLQEQRWNNQGQAVQVWKVQENIFLFSRENIFLFSISRASEENLPFTWN